MYCNNPPARHCTTVLCGEHTVAYADIMQLEPVCVRDTLQYTATHCHTLQQHTVPHCTTLHHGVMWRAQRGVRGYYAVGTGVCVYGNHMKESLHIYEGGRIYERVMSHIMKESCHTYEGVMSHV